MNKQAIREKLEEISDLLDDCEDDCEDDYEDDYEYDYESYHKDLVESLENMGIPRKKIFVTEKEVIVGGNKDGTWFVGMDDVPSGYDVHAHNNQLIIQEV